jgi:hypothetical protein
MPILNQSDADAENSGSSPLVTHDLEKRTASVWKVLPVSGLMRAGLKQNAMTAISLHP